MICEQPGCTGKAVAKRLCRAHYDRQRTRHRHRPERAIANRARNRALTRLAQIYPAKYSELFAEELRAAKGEQQMVAEITGQTNPKLRPGPRPEDETPIDRVTLLRELCQTCANYHERGHKCPPCMVMAREGPKPSVGQRMPSKPQRVMPQLVTALLAGRTKSWLLDQGFAWQDVLAASELARAELEMRKTAEQMDEIKDRRSERHRRKEAENGHQDLL